MCRCVIQQSLFNSGSASIGIGRDVLLHQLELVSSSTPLRYSAGGATQGRCLLACMQCDECSAHMESQHIQGRSSTITIMTVGAAAAWYCPSLKAVERLCFKFICSNMQSDQQTRHQPPKGSNTVQMPQVWSGACLEDL